MTAKGYRRRTIDWKAAYNGFNEIADQKKPVYRSLEAELLVTRQLSNHSLSGELAYRLR
jgi:hypothetical protein